MCILVHPRWQPEATEQVLQQLNHLSLTDAIQAVQELQGPKHFICSSRTGNSLTLQAELLTLDDQRHFSLQALVDSGCTGLLIDAGFVKAKGLNTCPLPRPIPVYNADGTLNKGGSNY